MTPTTEEAMTMEELLNEVGFQVRVPRKGELIEGTVLKVDPNEVLVDIHTKSEGVIPQRELYAKGQDPITLTVGEVIKVYVVETEDEKTGSPVLSLRKAQTETYWNELNDLYENAEAFEVEVKDYNKGGYIINVRGVRGFLPTSQLSRNFFGDTQDLIGTTVNVKALEVNRKRNRLIVSQKAVDDEGRAKQREDLFKNIQIGDTVKGVVSSFTNYGAFVNLGAADGLLHISEISWDRVNNIADILTLGEEVEVKVIGVDSEHNRISLSLRQLSSNPWDGIEEKFAVGKVVEGTVTKLKKYGAFLQLEQGVEGLLHISEISWDHVENTEDALTPGQVLTVKVLDANKEQRRISLSLRELTPRPDKADEEDTTPEDESAATANTATATSSTEDSELVSAKSETPEATTDESEAEPTPEEVEA